MNNSLALKTGIVSYVCVAIENLKVLSVQVPGSNWKKALLGAKGHEPVGAEPTDCFIMALLQRL